MSGFDFGNRPPWQAWAWCWCGSMAFVVSLYLVPGRLRRLPRSDPSQIKARLAAVLCTSFVTVLATAQLARPVEDGLPLRTWIGVDTNNLGVALVLPLVLTCSLFLGPLVTMAWMAYKLTLSEITAVGLKQPRARPRPLHLVAWGELVKKANLHNGTYSVVRNLVVGPLAEELVFRGCFVPVLLGAGVSKAKIIWLSPFLFGFAHFHHALEWLKQGYSARVVVTGVLFQMTYTSAFGAFAVFVHLRTGHLASAVLVHVLCNFMGVPDITFSVAPGNPRESTSTSVLYKHRTGLWCCYGIGICVFLSLLFPLTSPSLYASLLWSYSATLSHGKAVSQ